MKVTIRKAERRDSQSITSNIVAMALEGSDVQLSPNIVIQGVQSLLDKPEMGFHIVAEYEQEIIGSLVIVCEWSDWHHGVHWWIHSVYVSPTHRRKRVYQRMYQYIKEQARLTPSVKSLRLSVNKTNEVARRTYESLGMKQSNSIIYNTVDL